MTTSEIYQLDWGHCTAEGYKPEENEVKIVFNCDVTSDVKTEKVVQLVIGRLLWCLHNFPEGVAVSTSLDFRGQGIISSKTDKIKRNILQAFDSAQITNKIEIDFLV